MAVIFMFIVHVALVIGLICAGIWALIYMGAVLAALGMLCFYMVYVPVLFLLWLVCKPFGGNRIITEAVDELIAPVKAKLWEPRSPSLPKRTKAEVLISLGVYGVVVGFVVLTVGKNLQWWNI